MIVAVHQPHFLPWLGYLDRMAQADLFIVLDHVQFERRNYQNRTLFLLEGQARWLTVPVLQRSQKERILDKQIDNPGDGARRWASNHFQTLRYAYRHAPFFRLYEAQLREIFDAHWDSLVELNHALLEFLRAALDIRTPMVRSSTLDVGGHRSELILNLCQAAGADTYLCGMGGCRSYLDRTAFARAGIKMQWQEFHHPRYRQCGSGPFIEGLTALDLLFNCGPLSRSLLQSQARQAAAPPIPAAATQCLELGRN